MAEGVHSISNEVEFLGTNISPIHGTSEDENSVTDLPFSNPVVQRVGKFRVVKYSDENTHRLGKGSYGEVLKAYDDQGKCYAAKLIELNGLKRKGIEKNELLPDKLQLCHENIIMFCDYEEVTSCLFIFMELYPHTLVSYISNEKPIPMQKLSLVTQTAKGIEYLHSKRLAHRDLKPNNILIELLENGEPIVKITDFSHAKWLDESTSVMKTVLGNISFLPPELVNELGELLSGIPYNRSIDMYSLGIVAAFTCMNLTGQSWIWKNSCGVRQKRDCTLDIVEQYFREHWCSDELDGIKPIVKRLLRFHPQQRPQSIVRDLEELQATREVDTLQQEEHQEVDLNIESENLKSSNFLILLNKLGLQQYYDRKIGLGDLLKVKYKKQPPNNLKELPWVMLQGLMMMNYTARDSYDICDDSFQDCKEEINDDPFGEDTSEGIHPVDLFIATYLCCDPFVQQHIVRKMFECCLAVPLFVPIEKQIRCFMWPLEPILLEWMKNDSVCEASLVRHPMKIVSFLRVGRPEFSKSSLINEVISTQKSAHNIFCHHECENGSNTKEISDGLVELFVYLPPKKSLNIIKEELLVLSLRGDSCDHGSQVTILKDLSSIIVVVCDMSIIEKQSELLREFNGFDNVIYVLATCDLPPKKSTIEAIRTFSKEKSVVATVNKQGSSYKRKPLTEVKVDVQKKINDVVRSRTCLQQSLSELICNIKGGVLVDEKHVVSCNRGKILGQNLTSFLKIPISDFKTSMVPLQREGFWLKWANLEKKKFQLKERDSNELSLKERRANIWKEMNAIRKHQMQNADRSDYSNIIKRFKDIMLDEKIAFMDKLYCYQWLKIELDYQSRLVLPPLKKQQLSIIEKLNSVKGNPEMTDAIDRFTSEVSEQEKKIEDSSFGIEHIIREIGQIYEASFYSESDSLTFRNMPDMIAQIFLRGFPIEIMDGDAGAVPIQWIKAVFSCVHKHINDKKVFVLSVIGIQSSGKSTLLNAMLGAEFAVSAGRCTRGIFAQLFPVDKLNVDVEFDYLLVLDSEGLCAPDHQRNKFDHDNILAALVTCISDLTLINIQGEIVGKMEDVLEMTTHAMLRMNLANEDKKQRCMFIHQNVNALKAADVMAKNVSKLLEHLDEMIKKAAKTEGKGDDWYFNKVIDFSSSKDICYMSDFLSGTRPLAPISSGYAESIVHLHKKILEKIVSEKPKCPTIVEICDRLEDIWEALLSENFVMEFKNIISVQACLQLDRQFTKILYDSQVVILNEKRKVSSQLSKSSDITFLENISKNADQSIKNAVNKSKKQARTNLEKFVDTSEYRNILLIHKENKVKYLEGCLDTFSMEMMSDINHHYNQHYEALTSISKRKQHKIKLVQEALRLANDLRGQKPTEEYINKKFNEWWTAATVENFDLINTEFIRSQMETYLLKKVVDARYKIEDILPYLRGKLAKVESLEKGIELYDIVDDLLRFTQRQKNIPTRLRKSKSEDYRKVACFLNKEVFPNAHNYLELILIETKDTFYASCIDFIDHVLRICDQSMSSNKPGKIILSQFGKFAVTGICIFSAMKRFAETFQPNDDYPYLKTVDGIVCTMRKTLLDQFSINIQDTILEEYISNLDPKSITYDSWHDTVQVIGQSVLSKEIYLKDKEHRSEQKYLNRGAGELRSILDNAESKLASICIQNSTFCSSHALEFVQHLLTLFRNFNEQDQKYTFTWHCIAKYAVIITKYAIPHFESMNLRFEIQYGSKCKVEESRSLIKAFFRSQVFESEVTMSANVMFYSVLRLEAFYFLQTTVEDQVTRRFLSEIGFSKYDLITHILKYLMEEDKFDAYQMYLQDSYAFSLKWVKQQKDKFAFDSRNDQSSVYETTVDHLIEDLRGKLAKAINDATVLAVQMADSKMPNWCDTFINKCKEFHLYINKNDFDTLSRLEVRDLSTLKECLTCDLQVLCDHLKSNFMEIGTLRTTGEETQRSINQIMDTLWGCREQCHFCGEPCKHTTKGHEEDHECLQHRPCGTIGVFFHNTNELSPLICTTAVLEEGVYVCKNKECKHSKANFKQKYKNYKECLGTWNIKADRNVDVSKYWKWFMARYKDKLREYYGATNCEIPAEWTDIPKHEALESLKRFKTP